MPEIATVGCKSTGHDNCPPVEAVEGASNFTANGKPVVLVGDKFAPHGCKDHQTHQGYLAEGSPSFTVNGRAVGRVGDPISCGGTVAEGESNVIVGNGNEPLLNKMMCEHQEIVTRYIRREEDDIFFCLPLIADAMGNKANEKDRQGWHYLRDMFYKWLAGEANDKPQTNSSPFWVDIDWVLSYSVAKDKWDEAIQGRILNGKAKEEIKSHLIELGYIAEKRTEFDFINIPFSEWDKHHYQYIPIKLFDFDVIEEVFSQFTGLFVSLGTFTFKFLAKGKIIYQENDFDIQIEQVAGVVYDVFNFEESDNYYPYYDDFLGYWSCKEKNMIITPTSNKNYQLVGNDKFRDFREHNKIGNDFVVLSKQKLIDITSNKQ